MRCPQMLISPGDLYFSVHVESDNLSQRSMVYTKAFMGYVVRDLIVKKLDSV